MPSLFHLQKNAVLLPPLLDKLLLHAAKVASAWPDDVFLSFNLSSVQLVDPNTATDIIRTIEKAGLPAHRLEIEVTETAMMSDPETASMIIDELHTAGEDKPAEHIVRAILEMCAGLDLTVVAEGIEEMNQAESLKRYGCHAGQGYLFGKPQDEHKTMGYIREFMDTVSEEQQKSIAGKCILSAEDNEVNQIVLEHTLAEQDLPFVIVSNGEEAFDGWEALDPLLIFMDISMPVLNGIEAIKKIREAEAATGKHVPIAALTAHALSGDEERMLEAGADYYLTKPINPNLLLTKIAEIVGPGSTRAIILELFKWKLDLSNFISKTGDKARKHERSRTTLSKA
ncbi:Hybrid signal transduction histidine kinase I [Nymphon striatum]|nr:Hybrid signal transduction histidine kinase I [Nymphon striatum]